MSPGTQHRIPVETLGADGLSLARLSVDQHHRMAGTGVLVSGDPVELLDGPLIQKPSKTPRRVVACHRVREAFGPVDGDAWIV